MIELAALTGLLEILGHEGEPVPVPGRRFLLIDSAGKPRDGSPVGG